MNDLELRTRDAAITRLSGATLDTLAAAIRGELITADHAAYTAACSLWNATIDRRPALIVRCSGHADVIDAVNFARQHGLLFSIRSVGHNIAGSALCDGGLVIDLSRMKGVRVDAAARRAWVQPGACWGDVDRETQVFALAAPGGIVSTTGVAGLTLGGGFGWLTRSLGLTADNLAAATVVTGAGETLTTSAKQNEDLFWALRGGGGNFGVVTGFEFELHRVGPTVVAGMAVWPLADAPDVLRFYRDFAAAAPDELGTALTLRFAPPAPFLPPETHGTPIAGIVVCWSGPVDEAERVLAPLRAFGKPLGVAIGPRPFRAHQQLLDAAQPPGRRYYWKSEYLPALSDGLIDALVRGAQSLPGPFTAILMFQLGGRAKRIPEASTAAAGRDSEFVVSMAGAWTDRADDPLQIGWTRDVWTTVQPFGTGTTYINFLTSDADDQRVRTAFGANHERLARIKRHYDPDNLFRPLQNVRPSA